MENKPSSEATLLTRPRLYSIVHTYIHKQLPRDIHPAFKALRDSEGEEATLSPQIDLTEQPGVTLATKREGKTQTVQTAPTKDDDDDDTIPLYAAPQEIAIP